MTAPTSAVPAAAAAVARAGAGRPAPRPTRRLVRKGTLYAALVAGGVAMMTPSKSGAEATPRQSAQTTHRLPTSAAVSGLREATRASRIPGMPAMVRI